MVKLKIKRQQKDRYILVETKSGETFVFVFSEQLFEQENQAPVVQNLRGRAKFLKILGALNRNKELYIRYGNDSELRKIEPYAMGNSAFTNKFLLRGWQLSGPSVRGRPKGWKTYEVRKIRDIGYGEGVFDTPINTRDASAGPYKPGQDRMLRNVRAAVSF